MIERRVIDMVDDIGEIYFVTDGTPSHDLLSDLEFVTGRKGSRIEIVGTNEFNDLVKKVINDDLFESYRRLKINIVKQPSFQPAESWTVGHTENGMECRYAIGKTSKAKLISDADLLKLCQIIQNLSIGLIGDGPMGFDGETWKVDIEWDSNRISLCYWCDIPESWIGIKEIIELVQGIA